MNGIFEQVDIAEELKQSLQPRKYLGKYRGTVINNQDPLQMGRIQAIVPDVSELIPTGWAMPCVPFAFLQMGLFVLPPLKAGVWIEFEQGDPDYPIWSGGWWGDGQAPILQSSDMATPATPNVVIQNGINTILVHATPGPTNGIILSAGPHTPAGTPSPKIEITPSGIKLTVGPTVGIEITVAGVEINKGALRILP